MNTLEPEQLLAAPRGRRMLLALALLCEEMTTAKPGGTLDPFAQLAAQAAWRMEPEGSGGTVFGPGAEEFRANQVTPEQVAQALAEVQLVRLTPDLLRHAVQRAVDAARYWQEPDGEDALAASAPVRQGLRRFAEAVVADPASAWWSTGIDRGDQWIVFDEQRPGHFALPAREQIEQTRQQRLDTEAQAMREWPADPRANFSAQWWSYPDYRLRASTRSMHDGAPAGLWWVEDSFGEDTAEVARVRMPPRLRVLEIDGPAAWARLCREHPLVVTEQQKYDWLRTTGRIGAWVMPDWSSVAREWDAAHLTVAGYLTTAGRAVPVDETHASVLAGWDPDATFWFSDDVRVDDERTSWRRDDESEAWAPAGDSPSSDEA